MGKSSQENSMSKREEIRKKRADLKRRNMILLIGGITLFVILFVSALVLPGILTNSRPVGDIVMPAAHVHPEPNGLFMGDPNAPVKLVEYSDFQCPYCKLFADGSEQDIIRDYVSQGLVYFEYRPFTVIGSESDAAALAAYCAADQNKFWEYHDILFANITGEQVGDFYDKRLYAFAENIGLDMDRFRSCYKSQTFRQQLEDHRKEGLADGLKGTPAIYINGIDTSPTNAYQAIKDLLNP